MRIPLLLLGGALASASLSAQTLTWVQRNTGVAAGLQYTAAAYGAGKYAVVAYGNGATSGTFQSQVATSADAVTWSVVTLPTSPVVRGITYGGGLWLVPAERNGNDAGNTQNILTSPDGVTWTARTTGVGSLWRVAHTAVGAGNLFVAAGLGSAGPNAVYSTDAVTWTRVTIGAGGSGINGLIGQLAAGNGVVVAAGNAGGTVYTTTNGSAWTTVTIAGLGAANSIVGLTFAGGEFIAGVRADGGGTRIYTSANGATWTATGAGTAGAEPASFSANGLGASGAVSGGGARVIVAGGSFNLQTLSGVPSIVTATGSLATWTSQAFGTGEFASNNFAFFASNLWLVGNNNTQLFVSADTAGGSGGGAGGGGVAAPTITTQPVTQAAVAGGAVTFTVAASGTGNTYQWRFNGTAIGGATSATYTIAAVTAANAGQYSVVVTNAGGPAISNVAVLTVEPVPASVSFLGNLSVRARAGSGAETLIVGITVGGGASGPKSVLIRGIGPTLSTFGVTGALADPVLSVLQGTTPVISNDDWGSETGIAATSASVGAFPLPAGSKDSAISGTGIAAGSYTVQLTGKGGTTGNAMIELYDLTSAASVTATTPRFTNLSARTFGGTGADTLIVGFNIAGTGTRRLVVRAIGPGLAAFGVTGTMPDPKLELFNGDAKVGENDNWDAATLAAQQSVAAFPLAGGSRDAVLVSTLAPGSYTVQVAGGTAGVVLVEVYEAP